MTSQVTSLPASPGEGIEWKVGNTVTIRKPPSRRGSVGAELREGTITKVGRRWAEITVDTGGGRTATGRFEMATGYEEGAQSGSYYAQAWVDEAATERYEARQRKEDQLWEWRRGYTVRLSNWSTEKLDRLHALLVEIGEIEE